MSIEIVFAIAGVAALFISVWGGGIKAKEIEIPQSSTKARLILGAVGLVLIGVSIWRDSPMPALSAQEASPTVPIPDTPTSTPHPPTPTTVIFTETPVPSLTLTSAPTPDLIFNEKFDDNKLGWWVGDGSYNANYVLRTEIKDGKYSRYMEMNDKDSGYYGSMSIPKISEANFCLIFDAKKVSGTKDAGIIITVRAINYTSDTERSSFYRVSLYEEGKGSLYLYPKSGNGRQIRVFNNTVAWDNTLTHTVAISLQKNILEIIDWQTKTSLEKLTIPDGDLLSDRGNIYIGTELFNPGDNITIEFDNVLIYNRCPQ